MFQFHQFLGFLAFLTILTMGFWLMMFLINFAIYWAIGGATDLIKERNAQNEE
ncbi:hypothetical protein K5I29_02720 [Flavobacterium agricola]|uniref:Serine hydroxymethyltransferase n=1 Tax=Flavobacterium agricola TaxID=2870839 RepID=A0ABY6LZX6_9FLAO|nr:hypothetical protein [Flavobacterium agricola]UYW01850.1 hypothetical protein K5I29_02720 [Flavobacterium agricola]